VFENFSVRARQVVFAARVNAGQRGGKFIEMGDCLAALIIEDRGNVVEKLALSLPEFTGTHVNHSESHVPFFDAEAASQLLARIENSLPEAPPVGLGVEIPLATDLGEVFAAASEIQNRFHKSHVEPLHLLAAIFTLPSCQSAGLLQEFGITEESVLGAISS
jgi:ClpA/ClpB-like protein